MSRLVGWKLSLLLACVCLPGQVSVAQSATGFRQQAWMLPDEALLGFVEIPAGEFIMGSDPLIDPQAFENERWSAQRRQGRVVLDTYYIGRYEVTVAQYQAFIEASNYRDGELQLTGAPTQPVTGISWPDALAYARWLESSLRDSSLTPDRLRALLNTGWQLTLPTEAQWEKAARGQGSRIYPWGNQFQAGYARVQLDQELVEPSPVGSHPCPDCAYGLADMSGNVWEFTRSPYQPYPWDSTDNHLTVNAEALWVMRGGSFRDPPNLARLAVRGAVDPGARRDNIGFRLVLTRD
ncbi:MAG: SUMF1/EgtB/PvdO family nonheme iron enzyme [Pseudomonadales bacterium]|nr:SUMF1/EgtB/PvdO family nonheme iron enzyme [Pseudomonadales bacterium]